MITISPINPRDMDDIAKWPQYEGIHSQMNYAIRKDGWLDTYFRDPLTYCFAAKKCQQCVGFSLLINKNDGREAEYRIAVNPDFVGSGYGGKITRVTLFIGFNVLNFKTIFLIVRKNNPVAQRLYKKNGFYICGETTDNIEGKCVDFFIMKLNSNHFKTGANRCQTHSLLSISRMIISPVETWR